MDMSMVLVVAVIKMAIQIYHNPRCSKSRQTLAILEEQGVEADVVEYLKTPPSAAELKAILHKLGLSPMQLMRKGEAEFKEHVKDKKLDDAALIDMMVAHPILIERPIVIQGEKAAIGRPPESVLEILS